MSRDVVVIGCVGANLASLRFALLRLGVDAPVTEDPQRARAATHVILPGVGAAKSAMERLRSAGFVDVIPGLTQPVLGICLGMQLLFSGSEEEQTPCLGVIAGEARRLPQSPTLPVPEMGWNQLQLVSDSPLLHGVDNGAYAYFVHSYAVPTGTYTLAAADYGGPFSAVVGERNFYGTQFHPERSSRAGARILDNFLSL